MNELKEEESKGGSSNNNINSSSVMKAQGVSQHNPLESPSLRNIEAAAAPNNNNGFDPELKEEVSSGSKSKVGNPDFNST